MNFFLSSSFIRLEEKPQPYQFGLQLPATSVAEGILNFHHDLMQILVLIFFVVLVMLIQILLRFRKEVYTETNHLNHAPTLEMIWTIIPALILLLIAFPSFTLIYSADILADAFMTVKVYGHQWYWSYEFLDSNYLLNEWISVLKTTETKLWPTPWSIKNFINYNFFSNLDNFVQNIINFEKESVESVDLTDLEKLDVDLSAELKKEYVTSSLNSTYNTVNFNVDISDDSVLYKNSTKKGNMAYDSYMIPDEDIVKSSDRLLKVDNQLFLPALTNIRLIVSSGDVIHAWAVPALGVKIDACPGRLNQTSLYIKRPGVFYGMCSEICGANHGFMPIAVESIDLLGGLQLDSSLKKKQLGESLQVLFRYYVRTYLENK